MEAVGMVEGSLGALAAVEVVGPGQGRGATAVCRSWRTKRWWEGGGEEEGRRGRGSVSPRLQHGRSRGGGALARPYRATAGWRVAAGVSVVVGRAPEGEEKIEQPEEE